jgi:hypothetical protein
MYGSFEVALPYGIDNFRSILHYFLATFKVLNDCNKGIIVRKAFM